MGVLVQFNRRKAFLRQGEWFSSDQRLEKRLNETMEAWIQETGGPPLSDSDPERTVARTISARLGGRILIHQPGDPSQSRQVYFNRRQMRLY